MREDYVGVDQGSFRREDYNVSADEGETGGESTTHGADGGGAAGDMKKVSQCFLSLRSNDHVEWLCMKGGDEGRNGGCFTGDSNIPLGSICFMKLSSVSKRGLQER